jgi:hypothetical protein
MVDTKSLGKTMRRRPDLNHDVDDRKKQARNVFRLGL